MAAANSAMTELRPRESEHKRRGASAPAMLCVYAGQGVCLGFILNRSRDGFEAFSAADEKSLGRFQTQREATAAIMRVAP